MSAGGGDGEDAASIIEEYESALSDLKTNSKPIINLLTILAEENRQNKEQAAAIVRLIEHRLHKVIPTQKLPIIYLLDSIIKNVGEPYKSLFTTNIVQTFCNTFERVDQKTRQSLCKLRTTWTTLFPGKMLAAIDTRSKAMDHSWPITPPATSPVEPAQQPVPQQSPSNIHINPRVYPNFPVQQMMMTSTIPYPVGGPKALSPITTSPPTAKPAYQAHPRKDSEDPKDPRLRSHRGNSEDKSPPKPPKPPTPPPFMAGKLPDFAENKSGASLEPPPVFGTTVYPSTMPDSNAGSSYKHRSENQRDSRKDRPKEVSLLFGHSKDRREAKPEEEKASAARKRQSRSPKRERFAEDKESRTDQDFKKPRLNEGDRNENDNRQNKRRHGDDSSPDGNKSPRKPHPPSIGVDENVPPHQRTRRENNPHVQRDNCDEEDWISLGNKSDVGKKDVDYRGIRSTGGKGSEVITPEQVYQRAEKLLKSGTLTKEQCDDLEQQIRDVQRKREQEAEKKATTDVDMRQANNKNGGRNTRDGGRNNRGNRDAPWLQHRRGAGQNYGRGGFRGGPPPDMRWAGGPPRPDMGQMQRPPPPPQMPRPPPFMQQPPANPMAPPINPMMARPGVPLGSAPPIHQPPMAMQPPIPPEPPRVPPPTEIYSFGPGPGYSKDWDDFYAKNGNNWPAGMPFDMRFAGPPKASLLQAPQPPQPPVAPTPPVAQQALQPTPVAQEAAAPPPAVENPVDITSLFSKLVDFGIIGSSSQLATDEASQDGIEVMASAKSQPMDDEMSFKPSDLEPLAEVNRVTFDSESLKQFQFGVVQRMYRGLQCSSCGMRYPLDKQALYTQHLDWHFRQKKRKADGYVGSSREWFAVVEDWLSLADQADRISAGFGDEPPAADNSMEDDAEGDTPSGAPSEEVLSVCVDSDIAHDDRCKICREYFEQFWHEVADEWHLRDAIRVDGKTVHFHCYREFSQASLPSLNTPNTPLNKARPSFRTTSSEAPLAARTRSDELSPEDEARDEAGKPQNSLNSLDNILTSITTAKAAPAPPEEQPVTKTEPVSPAIDMKTAVASNGANAPKLLDNDSVTDQSVLDALKEDVSAPRNEGASSTDNEDSLCIAEESAAVKVSSEVGETETKIKDEPLDLGETVGTSIPDSDPEDSCTLIKDTTRPPRKRLGNRGGSLLQKLGKDTV